ncbi:MAG: 1-(5-phosphoribosyl)-5-[(5-phosphoribosylamino)methylideneamino]imidazole-4-carboxamide isomerase [Terrimonas ferruginea]|uniref:1-(5-phosphoribosyl)-5-[(5- phosphoribosylamino)methylideneamino]imidazole-4- carboxamide isomerase n=1 Tax=Terrimonas ferruginea TaxID=249 RepID=UPI000AF6C571|nr:1-(5-phosphoribosyl)-5-[(5-phosphoribosylamino)methylideneamino]imidazole-4-carboxamide isomerase [Terrimonas ferruginea]MBN8783820.1 1-(5-phosphoribosyl)-5-[(5-phosphoribosylamino)methylideneamino]imidazole-4-carboxamide isomerase [Terrimonas ferruginea]
MNVQVAKLDDVWPLRQEVMYPELPIDAVKLPDDAAGSHFGIYEDNQLLSVVSVFERNGEMQFRKLATRRDKQGKGLAWILLQHVLKLAEQKKVTRLWCNARLSATGLYEKMGLQQSGAPWNNLGHEFVVMEKKWRTQKMEIIPAIDIIDGKCVRLTQGDYEQKKVYNEHPLEVARAFEDAGLKRLHLVDLDGAKAKTVKNWKVLEAIACKTNLSIDFGGGIAELADVQIVFNSGAHYATVGSIAVKKEEEFARWLLAFGADRFLLGADVKEKKIAIHGWLEQTDIDVKDFIRKYQQRGVQQVFCTDVSKDGKLEGPSLELYKEIIGEFPSLHFIASGGVSSVADLDALLEAGCKGVIIGKAIYENRISLADLQRYN